MLPHNNLYIHCSCCVLYGRTYKPSNNNYNSWPSVQNKRTKILRRFCQPDSWHVTWFGLMKSACETCTRRPWCDELNLCLRRIISYDMVEDRIYEATKQLAKEALRYLSFFINANRFSATFLGVYVAEFILSKVIKNVKRMSPCYPEYYFVWNKVMKIDV